MGEQIAAAVAVRPAAPEARVELAHTANLPVLLAHEPLLERRQLHEHVEVPKDREHVLLVLPGDLVEVEDSGELGLAGMGEPVLGPFLPESSGP